MKDFLNTDFSHTPNEKTIREKSVKYGRRTPMGIFFIRICYVMWLAFVKRFFYLFSFQKNQRSRVARHEGEKQKLFFSQSKNEPKANDSGLIPAKIENALFIITKGKRGTPLKPLQQIINTS